MKYICTEDKEGKEEIFTFPNSIDHDAMADALSRIKNQTWGQWERVRRMPISAGFVGVDGKCYGNSETLGLESRNDTDSKILENQ